MATARILASSPVDRPDRISGQGLDVRPQSVIGEERHPGVVVAVAADEVAGCADPGGGHRVRLGPAALDEEGRSDIQPVECLEESLLDARLAARPIGMFGVKVSAIRSSVIARVSGIVTLAEGCPGWPWTRC